MSELEWTALIAACCIGYIVAGSFTWALAHERGHRDPDREVLAGFWPLYLLFAVLLRGLFTIGPRVVRYWRRPRLPRAEVRR